MSTIQPLDDSGHPIPVLRLKSGGARIASAAAISTRIGPFAGDIRVIALFATGPVFIRTGDATVVATGTDHFFPEGTYCDVSLGDQRQGRHSHLAVIRAEVDCTLYISEKE
ncbi:MAG: hypothetical protein WCK65_06630 [Rhodospirillaceae bacterium]